ncbi:MAG: rod shape-determining protein MreD [Parasporobacterium sp.]|nr:rod shape-determining protein MreD [Parasporobacterium sp.]
MSLYKIRNLIIAALIIIAAFILQSTVISRIPLLGCGPNLMLIITFIYGYLNGKTSGMLAGFFSGLLMDIFYCEVLGYNALILVLIGFISGIWNTFLYSDDLYIPLIIISGSDLCYGLVYYVFWFALRARFEFGYYLLHVILPEVLLTFIFGLIIYKPMAALLTILKKVPEE